MKNIEYVKWESEVSEYLIALNEKLKNNTEVCDLYNGFYVWDSEFKLNPKIMFIGINPGDGNPNNSKLVKVTPEDHMSYLEYWDEGRTKDYPIARETLKVFQMLGYSDPEIRIIFEKEVIKTNFYFIITRNEKRIPECLNKIGEFQTFKEKSKEFIKKIIEIVNPEIIICEGGSSFDNICRTYNISLNDVEWKNNCGSIVINNGIVCYGYSRRYSSFKNKVSFTELIKPQLLDLIPVK